MDRPLDLASVRRPTTSRLWIVGAAQFNHLTGLLVLDYPVALEVKGPAQPDFAARSQTEKLFRRILHKIVALNVEHPGKGDHPKTHLGGIIWKIRGLQLFRLILGVVVDDHSERSEHGHDPGGLLIQVVADALFQHPHIDPALPLAHTDALAEILD